MLVPYAQPLAHMPVEPDDGVGDDNAPKPESPPAPVKEPQPTPEPMQAA